MTCINPETARGPWRWPHFRPEEFECRCGTGGAGREPGCAVLHIDSRLLDFLEKLRSALGDRPLHINSGYRCPRHNAKVNGVPTSQHVLGLAADIVVYGCTPNEVADAAETLLHNTGGLGRYTTFTHVDVREGRARWRG